MANPTFKFAHRTKFMKASIIREILKVSSKPSVTSFAGGLPSPTSFPLKEFEHACREALRLDGAKSLQYMVTEGHYELKKYISGWLGKQGVKTKPEEMLLTQGSQQALDLLAKILLNPGDKILVENPSYLGAIQVFNSYEVKYVTVPMDDEGMKPEDLESALKKHRVKFIYTVPTFQNPSGITMTTPRRKALLAVARKYGVLIIEDDPYSMLRFKGKPVPSLHQLAGGRGVVYLSTFSKVLSPGIRLGIVVANKEIIGQLVRAKQASDLQTNSFVQYAVYHYCRMGYLEKHLPKILKDYSHRAKTMMNAIIQHFPHEVEFIEPEGGMFVWCRLPEGIRSSEVFKKALKKNVAFVDGSVFFANGGGENTMRLNFTNSTDEAIRSGIKRLGDVIREFIK